MLEPRHVLFQMEQPDVLSLLVGAFQTQKFQVGARSGEMMERDQLVAETPVVQSILMFSTLVQPFSSTTTVNL
jgi:hypothetical protein